MWKNYFFLFLFWCQLEWESAARGSWVPVSMTCCASLCVKFLSPVMSALLRQPAAAGRVAVWLAAPMFSVIPFSMVLCFLFGVSSTRFSVTPFSMVLCFLCDVSSTRLARAARCSWAPGSLARCATWPRAWRTASATSSARSPTRTSVSETESSSAESTLLCVGPRSIRTYM